MDGLCGTISYKLLEAYEGRHLSSRFITSGEAVIDQELARVDILQRRWMGKESRNSRGRRYEALLARDPYQLTSFY